MPHVKSPYPPVPDLPDLNYFSLLFETSPGKDHPRDFVIHVDVETGEQRTYGEFLDRIRDCATGLTASVEEGGIGVNCADSTEKEIIVIFSPNSLDYFVLVYAALLLAVPFALLPSKPTLGELVGLLNKLKPTDKPVKFRLFVHPSLLKLALEGAKRAGIPSSCVYILGDRSPDRKRLDIGSLVKNVRRRKLPQQPVVPATKDTLAYLMFSSGTSGIPKAVMVSHGNIAFSLIQGVVKFQADVGFQPTIMQNLPSRYLASLPFYHSYGLHYFILKPHLTPKTLYILPRWNASKALKAIEKYKIDFFMSVPSIIHQLVYLPEAAKADLSSIKGIAAGAAYLPPALGEKFRRLVGRKVETEDQLPKLGNGYGLSEATISCISAFTPGQFGITAESNSLGVLFPGLEARIVREDGSDADYDELGELLVHGDNVTLGYWCDEASTKSTFLPDKWLRTGDRFRVNKQGVFYYEDRLKDTLKISGAQVSPAEIEHVLLEHPKGLIEDVAVSGVPSELVAQPSHADSETSIPDKSGEHEGTNASTTQSVISRDERVPRAWVVLSPAGRALGSRQATAELDAWVRERLSRYKWLTGGIECVDEIPKNPTGKVLRRVLVDGFVAKAKKGRGRRGARKVVAKL